MVYDGGTNGSRIGHEVWEKISQFVTRSAMNVTTRIRIGYEQFTTPARMVYDMPRMPRHRLAWPRMTTNSLRMWNTNWP